MNGRIQAPVVAREPENSGLDDPRRPLGAVDRQRGRSPGAHVLGHLVERGPAALAASSRAWG